MFYYCHQILLLATGVNIFEKEHVFSLACEVLANMGSTQRIPEDAVYGSGQAYAHLLYNWQERSEQPGQYFGHWSFLRPASAAIDAHAVVKLPKEACRGPVSIGYSDMLGSMGSEKAPNEDPSEQHAMESGHVAADHIAKTTQVETAEQQDQKPRKARATRLIVPPNCDVLIKQDMINIFNKHNWKTLQESDNTEPAATEQTPDHTTQQSHREKMKQFLLNWKMIDPQQALATREPQQAQAEAVEEAPADPRDETKQEAVATREPQQAQAEAVEEAPADPGDETKQQAVATREPQQAQAEAVQEAPADLRDETKQQAVATREPQQAQAEAVEEAPADLRDETKQQAVATREPQQAQAEAVEEAPADPGDETKQQAVAPDLQQAQAEAVEEAPADPGDETKQQAVATREPQQAQAEAVEDSPADPGDETKQQADAPDPQQAQAEAVEEAPADSGDETKQQAVATREPQQAEAEAVQEAPADLRDETKQQAAVATREPQQAQAEAVEEAPADLRDETKQQAVATREPQQAQAEAVEEAPADPGDETKQQAVATREPQQAEAEAVQEAPADLRDETKQQAVATREPQQAKAEAVEEAPADLRDETKQQAVATREPQQAQAEAVEEAPADPGDETKQQAVATREPQQAQAEAVEEAPADPRDETKQQAVATREPQQAQAEAVEEAPADSGDETKQQAVATREPQQAQAEAVQEAPADLRDETKQQAVATREPQQAEAETSSNRRHKRRSNSDYSMSPIVIRRRVGIDAYDKAFSIQPKPQQEATAESTFVREEPQQAEATAKTSTVGEQQAKAARDPQQAEATAKAQAISSVPHDVMLDGNTLVFNIRALAHDSMRSAKEAAHQQILPSSSAEAVAPPKTALEEQEHRSSCLRKLSDSVPEAAKRGQSLCDSDIANQPEYESSDEDSAPEDVRMFKRMPDGGNASPVQSQPSADAVVPFNSLDADEKTDHHYVVRLSSEAIRQIIDQSCSTVLVTWTCLRKGSLCSKSIAIAEACYDKKIDRQTSAKHRIVATATVIETKSISDAHSLKESCGFQSATSTEKQMWRQRLAAKKPVYEWKLCSVEKTDHLVHLAGRGRVQVARFTAEPSLAMGHAGLPSMSLQSTANFFMGKLCASDERKLANVARSLDGHTIRFGTTCSGTDIGACVFAATISALCVRYSEPRLV